MTDEPESIGAILVAEIGSVTTRVMLLDVVDGEIRLICQIEKPSTIEPPHLNSMVAVLQAAADITKIVNRKLLTDDGQLLIPQNKERDGVNHVVALSSGAGNFGVIITAIASDVSAQSCLHACRSTYTSILQVITLDDFDKNRELGSAKTSPDVIIPQQSSSMAATSWIERQVQTMLALYPDVVLIAGGLENGPVDTIKRLAHIVALTTLRSSVDTSGQIQQYQTSHPVIYAGNSAAREQVCEVLAGRAEVTVLDNVRPSLEHEHLDPVRREIDRLYHEHILPHLPGMESLRRVCQTPITTVCNASGLMSRFIAERYERQVLMLDIGSTSSSAFSAAPGRYSPTVLGTGGSGYSITSVLKERGVANIMRWLPFPMSARDLMHWLLNKLVRPQLIPSSLEELLLEHAVTREALAWLLEAVTDECPDLRYDMLFAGGGVLAHAPHGLAALSLLDALQPVAEETLLDIYLDPLGLIPACGALSTLEPDAAVTLFDRDVLQNAPLATCVVALGDGKAGKVALEVEMEPLRGAPRKVSVHHGEIVRIPLEPGNKGKLSIQPASGVRVGSNAPGVKAESGVADISGSHLGIVLDARGRPLRLPEDGRQRRAKLWEWLVAMAVVKGQNPFEPADASKGDKKVQQQEEELELALPEEPQPLDEGAAPVAQPVEQVVGDGQQPPAEEAAEAPQAPVAKSKRQQAKEAKQKAQEEKKKAQEAKKQAKAAAKSKKGKKGQEKPEVVGDAEQSAGGEGALQPGSRISLADLDLDELPQEQQPPAPTATPEAGSVESDLASLRQTVEDPNAEKKGKGKKKKGGKGGGLFGKKK